MALDLTFPSFTPIKEGINYKAGEPAKWYVEVKEETYKALNEYKEKNNIVGIDAIITQFLIEKGLLKPDPSNPTRFL